MTRILLFNKPYGVLSQFTDAEGRATLSDHLRAPGMRPAGRLDYDSEGLLVLTDDGRLQQSIANPRGRRWKHYWVQVEGDPDTAALQRLQAGVELRDGLTAPALVRRIDEPAMLWPRLPPIRERRHIPTTWLDLAISEGRNRQIRRMTAATGFPTLRLIRYRVDEWTLEGLAPGEARLVEVSAAQRDLPAPVARSRSLRK